MAKSEKPTFVEVPLEFVHSDDLPTRYATHLVVQHTEHEFKISFYDASHPPLLGSVKDQDEILKRPVRAQCVAKVVVAPKRMEEFVKVLQGNIRRYKKNYGTEGGK